MDTIIVDLNRSFDNEYTTNEIYMLLNEDGQIFYGRFVQFQDKYKAEFEIIKIVTILIEDYTIKK